MRFLNIIFEMALTCRGSCVYPQHRHFSTAFTAVVGPGLLAFLISLSAHADNLVSRPVGYYRIDLVPGEQRLTSLPFVPLDDSFSGGLVASPSVSILLWDSTSASYTSELPADICTLPTGSGFWLINNTSITQTIYLTGSVILDETRSLTLPASLSLIGYPYSAAIAFTNTALGQLFTSGALSGDRMSDAESQITLDGFIKPGHGYWYQHASTNPLIVDETRPYGNPFPSNDSLLEITNIEATESGVTLTFSLPGDCTSYDIFSKDLTNDAPLVLDSGWTLTAFALDVGPTVPGQPLAPAKRLREEGASLLWTDNQVPITSRLYLVARADIDLNQNGIPDARERFLTEPGNETSALGDGGLAMPSAEAKPMPKSKTTNPKSKLARSGIIYVDQAKGSDSNDGFSKDPTGLSGPKKTAHAGFAEAREGEIVEVRPGRYAEGAIEVPDGVKLVCVGHVIFE